LKLLKPKEDPYIGDFSLYLEHKSGDHWLAWVTNWDISWPAGCIEAQFQVDATGIVTHLGLNVRLEDGVPLIWFERVGISSDSIPREALL
jgi:hypothetical protein